MASIRAPPMLRHLLISSPRTLRASNQRRWAQVHDVRFLATTQQPRNVLEKYRDKLDRKAKEEGHQDIESLRVAYAEKIKSLRKQASVAVPTPSAAAAAGGPTTPPPPAPTPSAQAAASPPPPPPAKSQSVPKNKLGGGTPPLSSILNMEKASTLPATEISAIWKYHHATKPNSLCAVIPSETFERIEKTARQFPSFVLPVPHPEQGAEIHFLQWTWDAASKSVSVLFTQLAEYKARGEFAQPHTTVTHYTELDKEKGVVFMQGQVVEDRRVEIDEARWLVMCLQKFYGGWEGVEGGERRRELLEWFGKGDGRFSVEKLLEEAERMG
ncbi:ATP11 protein-domain-containing protein [Cladorrhinum sp. PSN259]|nr:ATP11 protein-domain-containing protein [Cladorrhinum sp. PSN259]